MSKEKNKTKAESEKINGDALVKAFEAIVGDKEMSFQFLDMFPCPIEILAPDGTTVYINRALCEQMNIADRNQLLGRYNFKSDPIANDMLGLRDDVTRMLNGEAYTIHDIRLPLEALAAQYDKKDENLDAAVYMDVSSFPLRHANGDIAYIVLFYYTKHNYKGRKEIIKAQEYINANWFEEYDADKIARAANLCCTRLIAVFKQYSNETPFEYYRRVKIDKIKAKLLDPNISITEAFAACGVDYTGSYAHHFKIITGRTPSEYRKEKFRAKR